MGIERTSCFLIITSRTAHLVPNTILTSHPHTSHQIAYIYHATYCITGHMHTMYHTHPTNYIPHQSTCHTYTPRSIHQIHITSPTNHTHHTQITPVCVPPTRHTHHTPQTHTAPHAHTLHPSPHAPHPHSHLSPLFAP